MLDLALLIDDVLDQEKTKLALAGVFEISQLTIHRLLVAGH
jgi:hypothetical protein